MATLYTFTLENGATLHAASTSLIEYPGGVRKTPDQVLVDDMICAAETCNRVTAVDTAEIAE